MANLLYGSGLRLMEAHRLRVKDLVLDREELIVRDAKGGKDRVTGLPAASHRSGNTSRSCLIDFGGSANCVSRVSPVASHLAHPAASRAIP